MSLNCNDANDGRADFLSGKKDEDRYNDAANGADYRRGWQLARIGQTSDHREAKPIPVAAATISDDPPWPSKPTGVTETAQSQSVAPELHASDKSPTREDVRLAVGDDKRKKKTKPAIVGQIDMFG